MEIGIKARLVYSVAWRVGQGGKNTFPRIWPDRSRGREKRGICSDWQMLKKKTLYFVEVAARGGKAFSVSKAVLFAAVITKL